MRLPKMRRAVARHVGASIAALTFLGIVLAVVIIVLFSSLIERHAAMGQSVRENALWAAYQADREASRLLESLARHDLDAAQLHYDILYSRVKLIGSGQYAVNFDSRSKVGLNALILAKAVLDMADTMDLLRVDPDVFPARRQTLFTQASRVRDAGGELIISANTAISEMKVAERAEEHRAYWNLGGAVVVLTAILILMIGLLGLQVTQISRAGRKLELLSRKTQRTAEAALAANRAKSIFLATMSHEIRTPLNGIVGMAELMSSTDLNTEQRQHLRAIGSSAGLLLDIISDVLDFSKLEATEIQIERRPHALPALEQAVVDVIGARASAAGLAFSVHLPAVTATIDAGRLRQVLINLAGNAIKFTPQGGTVSIQGTLAGETLRVEVIDSGPGISAEAQAKLFREFSQVDGSNTRTHGGTGLGLAISKRMMVAMGGRIGVISAPGQGSTFWLDLPAGPIEPLGQEATEAEGALEPKRLAGRALVVEDNAINRQVAGGMLRNLGLSVDFAENGRDAVEMVARNPPDIVVMDMQMPVMDGLDATRAIRASGYRRPIVGLTANAFTTDRQACLAAGMDDFLAKPVTRDKLLRVLEQQLGCATPGAPASPVEGLENGTPVVDEDYRRMMIDEFGADEFAALAERFLADAEGLVAEVRSAQASADPAAYDAALHRLKGSALTLGFNALAHTASTLREALPRDAAELGALDTEIERARAA